MHFLDFLAEQRSAEGERNGPSKVLPGAGAPLILRAAYCGWLVGRFAVDHSITRD